MPFDATDTLGAITAQVPEAAWVFDRHGLDWSVDGHKPLQTAAPEAAPVILDELQALRRPPRSWMTRPLSALIAYLVTQHHAPLDELFSNAIHAATAVGRTRPEAFEVVTRLSLLRDDLVAHMAREERLIFPPILRGDRSWIPSALGRMHDDHVRQIDHLRDLTHTCDRLPASPEADELKRLVHLIHALLREHLHLEDHVLFPRARAELPPEPRPR